MPPTRRPLKQLGSLQLVGYANNPTRVITELAFIADAQANAGTERAQSDVDTPLEVQFEEFMYGVNSRGRATRTRQRKMTIEQAAAVLLVTVQKGHVELIAKKNDPHAIDVIKILPEAKKLLAAFLPKLRGYGDIPYDQQYRGAIALAKRHFFPKGKAPTKKELMALLLQSYQEKRELALKCQTRSQPTKALGIQTSLQTIGGLPYIGKACDESSPCVQSPACTNAQGDLTQPESSIVLPNNNAVDPEHTTSASGTDPDLGNEDNYDIVPELETEPARLVACTPVAPRSFNPYMTPVSNPRHVAATTSTHDESPTRTTISGSHVEITSDDDSSATDEAIEELLQATATSQGRLNYYYNKFITACQKITFLEGQKEGIQREFELTRKKLDETEQRLREANGDKWKLNKLVAKLHRQIDSIYNQLGLLRGMTDPDDANNGRWSVFDVDSQEGFDPNSV